MYTHTLTQQMTSLHKFALPFSLFLFQGQVGSGPAPLSMLDSSSSSFRNALVSLDRMPTRFCNTVFVLYCQRGQSKVEEILANQVRVFLAIHVH